MKQILLIIIAAVLMMTMLSACGDVAPNDPVATQPKVNEPIGDEPIVGDEVIDSTENNPTINDTPSSENVPFGTYTSQVGGYTLTFGNYNSETSFGNVVFTYPDGTSSELGYKMGYIINGNEDVTKAQRMQIGTVWNDAISTTLSYFTYYIDYDVLSADNLGFSDFYKGLSDSNYDYSYKTINGYFPDDNGAFLCFYKGEPPLNIHTLLPVPDPTRTLFATDYFYDGTQVTTRYFYEDEVELVCTKENSATQKTHTYRIQVGNYIDDIVLEYKAIDYENMTGLQTIFRIDKDTTYYDFIRSDVNSYLPQNTIIVDYKDGNLPMLGNDTIICDSFAGYANVSSGEGFYLNDKLITPDFTVADLYGEPTFIYFTVKEEISYSNGEYVSTFGEPIEDVYYGSYDNGYGQYRWLNENYYIEDYENSGACVVTIRPRNESYYPSSNS